MSQNKPKVSQKSLEMSGTGLARAYRETGQMSRPASRPGTPVPLSQDRRFDGWLAGATEAQQAAWEERQKKAGKA